MFFLCSSLQATETHVDGFSHLISAHKKADYFVTHRGAGTEMAYVTTTRDRFTVVWESATLPQILGERVVFAWDTTMSGLYHRSGAFLDRADTLLVELFMNNKQILAFPIALKGDSTVLNGQADDPLHVEMKFDYLGHDPVGNVNGITYLSVPASMLVPGEPVNFKMVALPADQRAFYCVGCTKGVWEFAATLKENPMEMVMPADLQELVREEKRIKQNEPKVAGEKIVGPPVILTAQDTHVAIIAGLAADADDAAIIRETAILANDFFIKKLGCQKENVRLLADRECALAGQSAESTSDNIVSVFNAWQSKLKPEDTLILILIGNANRVDDRVMFNIRGPDLQPDDFRMLLDALPCRHMVVCVLTPVSGAFIRPLSMRGRVIIAACGEDQIYRANFARPFLRALSDPTADINGDGRISVLEAFDAANREVVAMYERSGYLRTEHALLEDSGSGSGSMNPERLGTNGSLASRFFLQPAQ